ncbi:SET domain-containing protein [Crassisporium funariophilum]|nr:SET domain-containing protein [Crassisporium funariophilum]
MSSAITLSSLALGSWLSENGGGFHPNVRFVEDSFGSRIVASLDLPEDATIVSCPFELAITEPIAKDAVLEILGITSSSGEISWSERQWISTYISLHWILKLDDKRLRHDKYLDTLPAVESLRTPLHFTTSELNLFKGSNLYGATLDRDRHWRSEWEQCRKVIGQAEPQWGDLFSWDKYLTGATYLSSRAFPSTILSPNPSLIHSPSTQPVLLPGVDALNHKRGQPVSWVVTHSECHNPETVPQNAKISLVLHTSAVEGQELFNNYGAKPNSEFILGYGFSTPNNPEDTIVLKIGGIEGQRWEIGRDAHGVEGLWKEIITSITGSSQDSPTYDDLLDASSMLQDMVATLVNRLPMENKSAEITDIRPEVLAMFHDYLEGQQDVLQALMEFAKGQERVAIEIAREQGIDLVLEEED